MARKPSPWYREDREGWFVTLNGRRHFLGAHPEGAPTPKKSERTKLWNAPRVILEAFHKLVAEGPPEELRSSFITVKRAVRCPFSRPWPCGVYWRRGRRRPGRGGLENVPGYARNRR